MLSTSLQAQIAATVTAAQLDPYRTSIWRERAAGRLSDEEAQSLSEAIHARSEAFSGRTAFQAPLPLTAPTTPTGRPLGRSWSFSTGKARPRSPDLLRSARRRQDVARSNPLPPPLSCAFTEHERAALEIVARRWMEAGRCDLTMGEIAGRAGVSDSTARRAMRHAVQLGLVEVQQRRRRQAPNLPNLITIVSAEWRTWLANRPKRKRRGVRTGGGTGGGRGSGRSPTKNQVRDSSEKGCQRHRRRAAKREDGPPDRATGPI